MRKLGILFAITMVLALPPTAAFAQYEGSDAAYAQKQDQERRGRRSNRGMIKLGIAGLFLVVAGGGWVLKKVRGNG